MAQMLKGGVIMDVTTVEEARIAEEAGATAVMALERVPADIRKEGGVARMSDPSMITAIKQAVTIPVMAKARIGHFVEAQILEALGCDYVDESEVRLACLDSVLLLNCCCLGSFFLRAWGPDVSPTPGSAAASMCHGSPVLLLLSRHAGMEQKLSCVLLQVLTPADDSHHINKHNFKVPFVCGCRDLGEALRRVAEGAAMIRTKVWPASVH